MPLAVIIPALNEASVLPQLLRQLREQQDVALEIVVCDGGSSDGTVALAQAAGAQVVQAARGRGTQMNAGARASRSDWLLFLHADSGLSSDAQLCDALAMLSSQPDAAHCAGHFPLRFRHETPGHDFFYRYVEGKTRLNRPYTINGDQGLLISRAFFETLGGYDERLPFLEDQRIAAEIFRQGRWLLLPGELSTSARRFETEGYRQRYTLMALMMGLHAAGAEEFFAQAPEVYRAQAQTAALDLRPFLRLMRKVLATRGRWRTLAAAGRFVRENAWQLFYYRDIRREDAAFRSLRFFERHLERKLDNRLCDGLATLLLAFWFYLWLPLQNWAR